MSTPASTCRADPSWAVHAIMLVLDDVEMFAACLSAIYPFLASATVSTTYDRDRFGNPVEPHGLIELLLSREVDPHRKVDLIVTTEGGEPRQRNRAMDFARNADRVVPIAGQPADKPLPSVFWHIDADEIYDPTQVPALLDWVRRHPAQIHEIEGHTYFRSWNWRIPDQVPFVAFTRPGTPFGWLRRPYPFLSRRLRARASQLIRPSPLKDRIRGIRRIPRDIAVCHHGSYVGDRARIEEKLARSGHRDEIGERWLADVWDRWDPTMRDFHPVRPSDFPYAEMVATEDLPVSIRRHPWPEGWIEGQLSRPD